MSRLIHSCHISVMFFSCLQPVTSTSFWNNDTCVWLSSLVKQIELQMKFSVLLLVLRYWNQAFFGNARVRDGLLSVLYVGGRRRSHGRTKALTATWRVP